MMVVSKAQDYQLLGDVLDQVVKEFGYSLEDLNVELFASDKQHVLDLYCSKGNNLLIQILLALPKIKVVDGYSNPRVKLSKLHLC